MHFLHKSFAFICNISSAPRIKKKHHRLQHVWDQGAIYQCFRELFHLGQSFCLSNSYLENTPVPFFWEKLGGPTLDPTWFEIFSSFNCLGQAPTHVPSFKSKCHEIQRSWSDKTRLTTDQQSHCSHKYHLQIKPRTFSAEKHTRWAPISYNRWSYNPVNGLINW